jgi:hypothetical protein
MKQYKDSEKETMYAMLYRDIATGSYGIFYARDKQSVEEFTSRIRDLIGKDAEELEEEDMMFRMEELWVEFPDIREMDKLDYNRFGPLPNGGYGFWDDAGIYCFINGKEGDDLHLWSPEDSEK